MRWGKVDEVGRDSGAETLLRSCLKLSSLLLEGRVKAVAESSTSRGSGRVNLPCNCLAWRPPQGATTQATAYLVC